MAKDDNNRNNQNGMSLEEAGRKGGKRSIELCWGLVFLDNRSSINRECFSACHPIYAL